MLKSRTQFGAACVRAVFIPRADFIASVVATYGDRLTAASEHEEYDKVFHELTLLRRVARDTAKRTNRSCKRGITTAEKKAIIHLKQAGLSANEIAMAIKVTKNQVYNYSRFRLEDFDD